jgi:heme/copper-type cytochrome/quinol oxidase subunit 1
MRRVVPALVAVVGVVLAAIGVWSSTATRAASFGWTAYAPLSSESYPVFVGPQWWALVLIAVGGVAVGSAVTLLLVRRRPR